MLGNKTVHVISSIVDVGSILWSNHSTRPFYRLWSVAAPPTRTLRAGKGLRGSQPPEPFMWGPMRDHRSTLGHILRWLHMILDSYISYAKFDSLLILISNFDEWTSLAISLSISSRLHYSVFRNQNFETSN